jgi:hypothetical protein
METRAVRDAGVAAGNPGTNNTNSINHGATLTTICIQKVIDETGGLHHRRTSKSSPTPPRFAYQVSISPDFGSLVTLTDPLSVTNTYLTSTTDGTVTILQFGGRKLPAQPLTHLVGSQVSQPDPTVVCQNAVCIGPAPLAMAEGTASDWAGA